MIKKFFFIVAVAFCFVGRVEGFPTLTGRVVDEAHILTNQQKNDLEQVLEQAHPHQVVAVSLKSLDGQEIEEYGYQLGRYWGIGRRGEDDGVLVLIAPDDGQLRIEVGYGLEHILTDARSSQIISRIMLPLARNRQYDESLIQGSKAVVSVLNGEVLPVVETPQTVQQEYFGALAIVVVISMFLFFCLTFGLFFVQNKCKQYKRNSRQNRFLFFYENVLFQSIMYNLYVTLMAAAVGSFLLYAIVLIPVLVLVNVGNIKRWIKNPKFPYKKQAWQDGSGGGSSGFGHSSGWGSGGGSSFHGGGGSFGGGGASGRF